MKLIDGDKLYDLVSDKYDQDTCCADEVLEDIDSCEAISVNNMTCEHCKRFAVRENKNENSYGVCQIISQMHSDRNFCSYFENK